jgi:hypothetical protein
MTPELYNLIISFATLLMTPGRQASRWMVRPLLDAMAAEWSLVQFDLRRPTTNDDGNIVLGKGQDGKLWNIIRNLTPTLLSSQKGKATVIRLFDRDAEGKAVARAFGDLRTFGIRGGAKIAKRLSTLWQEVSHFGIHTDFEIFAGNLIVTNGQAVSVVTNRALRRAGQKFGKGGTTIAIYDVPANLEKVFDGKGNYIRPSVAAAMMNEALDRARTRNPRLSRLLDGFAIEVEDGKLVNIIPTTAGPFARRTFNRRFAARVYNGRLVLPELGMVKGDWIIAACDEALCADFVVASLNIKPELYSLNGTVYFTANPVYEGNAHQVGRQAIAHLHHWVLPKGRLIDGFRRFVSKSVASFRNGTPLFIGSRAVEDADADDAINDMQNKAVAWTEAGLPIRLAQHLSTMLTGQFRSMNMKGADKDRRDDDKFPLEAAEHLSAKSVADLMISGYVPADFHLPEGVWMNSPVGMITADNTYSAMITALGNGDGDDHVETIMVESLHTADVDGLHFEAGEMATIVVRYPLGYSSDGKTYGSEYFILKPDASVERKYARMFPNGLRTVDFAMRPNRADRITINQTLFPQSVEVDVYDFEAARQMFWANTFSLCTGGIGAMANLQMLCASMGIAVALPCDTETMVDAVAGVAPTFETSAAALAAVRAAYNDLASRGLPIDPVALDRLARNFTTEVKVDPNGLWKQLYDARDAEMRRGMKELDTLQSDGLADLRRMFRFVAWRPYQGGDAPLLVNLYREVFNANRRPVQGESAHVRFRRIGDTIVAKMEELGYTDIMDRALAQAIAHQLTAERSISTDVDQPFFQGALFDHTLELFTTLFAGEDNEDKVAINCTANGHADGCFLLTSVDEDEAQAHVARGLVSEVCHAAGKTSWAK